MQSKQFRVGSAASLVIGLLSTSGALAATAPGAVTEKVLYSFGASSTDGSAPVTGLAFGNNGSLFGATSAGGAYNAGAIFTISQLGKYSALYSFDPSGGLDASQGLSQLALGSDGNFYGTNWGINGSAVDYGSAFMVTPAGVETVLHTFTGAPDGAHPIGAALVEGNDGNYYGVATRGGTGNNNGVFYKMTPAGAVTVLYSFGTTTNDGSQPQGTLLLGPDGNFWGTTLAGGVNGAGTVFKVTPAGVETVVYSFGATATDGKSPAGGLAQGTDGSFWGATTNGGSQGTGVIYNITLAGAYSVDHDFYGLGTGHAGAGDGAHPSGPLIVGSDGRLYGVTSAGGQYHNNGTSTHGYGVVYSYGASGEQVVYSFGATASDGQVPQGALVQVGPGTFFGTTQKGGANAGAGTIYKLTLTPGRAFQ